MLKQSNLGKYLAHYAEAEAVIPAPPSKHYSVAIVVPACGETHEFLDTWSTALCTHNELRPLVVLIVNADQHTEEAYTHANRRLIAHVLTRPHVRLASGTPTHLVTYDGFDVLLLDRSEPPSLLPDKSGVGLARKLGGDVVCAWHHRGVVHNPWWMSTDADVELPADIVRQLCAIEHPAGVVCLPFEHVACDDARVTDATFAVEVDLRYHSLGLAHAGSTYAWPALGSCLAVHTSTYASVRGFPKRQAGEDHYLLQKAAKLSPIAFGAGAPVRIRARRSCRTPFGTGRSVEELLQARNMTLLLRHPDVYVWLGRVIALLDTLGAHGDWQTFERGLLHSSSADVGVATVLERIGALRAWRAANQINLSPTARKRRLHEWFDGLRQLQFLRGLENTLPPLQAEQALRLAPFTRGVLPLEQAGTTPTPISWLTLVERLRKVPQTPAGSAAATRDLTPPHV